MHPISEPRSLIGGVSSPSGASGNLDAPGVLIIAAIRMKVGG